MKRALLIFICFCSLTTLGQTPGIESLRKSLPTINGTERVDQLIELAREFHFQFIRSDSSLKYAREAFNEASAINYKTGMGVSLVLQAEVYGRLLGNLDSMEVKCKKAIKLLNETKDWKNLAYAHCILAIASIWRGQYEQARAILDKAKDISVTNNEMYGLGWYNLVKGLSYNKKGHYWEGFEYLMEAQRIGKEVKDSLLTCLSLGLIARAFNFSGAAREAVAYYHESFRYKNTSFFVIFSHTEDLGAAYLKLKQYDSALYYQRKHRANLDSLITEPAVRKRNDVWLSPDFTPAVQLANKQYDKVLQLLEPALPKHIANGDMLHLMQSFLQISRAYEGKKNYQTALHFARRLLRSADKTGNPYYQKEAYALLASFFNHLKQGDSAYHYLSQYTVLNDSMEIAQFAGKTALFLAASESENRIRLLKKDKEIFSQQLALNKRELQNGAQLKNLLITGLIAVFLFSLLVVRNVILKRKNEKLLNTQEQQALKRKALELEMQALRAQMNPHFIFNCLSAIDNLVQTQQSDKATTYLARFAKLIRGVLDSSKNNLVPFQNDFETLKLYLEMEQFRCNNKFYYELNADQELLQGDYKVPPLIVQPFIENAIHHGLLNKHDNNRRLEVSAKLKDEKIIYSVTDNGIGRKKAGILKERNKPGQHSYGIDITRERIHLHNKNSLSKDILISDLETDGMAIGTKAVVTINCFES